MGCRLHPHNLMQKSAKRCWTLKPASAIVFSVMSKRNTKTRVTVALDGLEKRVELAGDALHMSTSDVVRIALRASLPALTDQDERDSEVARKTLEAVS